MRNIDLTQQGGFPLTQDTLKYMQEMMQEIFKSSYAHLMIEDTGNFILGGASLSGVNVSAGWLVMDGELIELISGTGTYVEIKQAQTSVQFENSASVAVYTQKFAEPTATATGNILLSDFQRISNNKTVVASECTHIDNRTYSYELPKFVSSIDLNTLGNTTAGFILNKITPFAGIPNGYQLLVRCGEGTGLTYSPVLAPAESNFHFNRSEHIPGGGPIIIPYFGNSKFIGSNANGSTGAGYAKNLQVLFQWSEQLEKWIEITRTSGESI